MNFKPLGTLAAVVTAALVSSCSQRTDDLTARYDAFNSVAYKANNPAAVQVKVSLSKQILYVMENDRCLLATPVCVGAANSKTPVGSFRILGKQQQRRANTHGWAHNPSTGSYRRIDLGEQRGGERFIPTPMPFWCSFYTPSYGIHTGYVYPYPKTHGCIRMHHNVTPKFFSLVQVGTPVLVAYSQSEDSSYGKDVVHPPNPGPIPDNPQLECSEKVFSYYKPFSLQ